MAEVSRLRSVVDVKPTATDSMNDDRRRLKVERIQRSLINVQDQDVRAALIFLLEV